LEQRVARPVQVLDHPDRELCRGLSGGKLRPRGRELLQHRLWAEVLELASWDGDACGCGERLHGALVGHLSSELLQRDLCLVVEADAAGRTEDLAERPVGDAMPCRKAASAQHEGGRTLVAD